jgi:hypothetical protein
MRARKLNNPWMVTKEENSHVFKQTSDFSHLAHDSYQNISLCTMPYPDVLFHTFI